MKRFIAAVLMLLAPLAVAGWAVHEANHPWSYTCPACGLPVIQRHRESK
ncbi:MAG: hypothetical protein K8T20_10935 [Planctomycetes bacterium]|nr:hypothetical protein [Planctomycetota bacterium]